METGCPDLQIAFLDFVRDEASRIFDISEKLEIFLCELECIASDVEIFVDDNPQFESKFYQRCVDQLGIRTTLFFFDVASKVYQDFLASGKSRCLPGIFCDLFSYTDSKTSRYTLFKSLQNSLNLR